MWNLFLLGFQLISFCIIAICFSVRLSVLSLKYPSVSHLLVGDVDECRSLCNENGLLIYLCFSLLKVTEVCRMLTEKTQTVITNSSCLSIGYEIKSRNYYGKVTEFLRNFREAILNEVGLLCQDPKLIFAKSHYTCFL